MPSSVSPLRRGSRWLAALLWVLAALLTIGAAFYQRMTGPSHRLGVDYEIEGHSFAGHLPRNWTTGEGALVKLPAPPEGWTGRLLWKRYPTSDDLATLPMEIDGEHLVARLPSQPPAGKVQYHVVFEGSGIEVHVPAPGEGDPILRYKGAVPLYVLIPHILVMFLSMLVGVRAGLAALFRRHETRRLAWLTLAGLTLGGLVLGPITQKLAFGAFWTGWPCGSDLTDNKALIMWGVWLGACLLLGRRSGRRDRAGRVAVIGAALVMLAVYLIPHSLQGSELDYEKLKDGVPVEDAIGTG